jgi:hypothetical protein
MTVKPGDCFSGSNLSRQQTPQTGGEQAPGPGFNSTKVKGITEQHGPQGFAAGGVSGAGFVCLCHRVLAFL